MGMFSVGFGLSDFIYEHLERFRDRMSAKTQERLSKFIEKTVYLFSLAGPLMTLPQVIQIFTFGSAAGLSIITWSSYLFLSFFWVTYGVFIRNEPIVFANVLWIIMNVSTIVGIFIYG